ncbi:hypothetical protein [Marininema halotolerans]|uniref:Phr family secreted Rap phosphatase inhibitor n=1 Tax=Marininema halotolerans TaxID=1155944 RepID=A0A1I6UGE2_9BACL|nr:hypothetical protein [Marininema halotolerans]SFT00546.1 hypothetical protein SAMN05444972_11641 [Marininema halotolerans]
MKKLTMLSLIASILSFGVIFLCETTNTHLQAAPPIVIDKPGTEDPAPH